MAGASSPTQDAAGEMSPTAPTPLALATGEELPPAAMTGGRERRRQPWRRRVRRPPPIHKLGEDLLLEIFMRLPSLATLVRAALACRAWRRAVASSPAFRRRFGALHPPPLLGLFFEAPGTWPAYTPAFPSFCPARRGDGDLNAAVRGGDFFLTSIDDLPSGIPCWDMVDCPRGRVLFMNWDGSSLVVFNPLTRQCEDVLDMVSEDTMSEYSRGQYVQLNARLIFSDEDPASFRVVVLAHDESRVRATSFSPATREWSFLPWVDAPAASGDLSCWIHEDSMQANGSLYWVYQDWRYLVSLDTATMEFHIVELPPCLKYNSFEVGEKKDGATCIVYSDQLNVGVLTHTRADGVEKWSLDRVVPLDRGLERVLGVGLGSDLVVLAVRDGYVYLAASANDPQTPCWFLSLCLETMRLEMLFRRRSDSAVYPYIMAWPPSLVGNYGRFALEDALSVSEINL